MSDSNHLVDKAVRLFTFLAKAQQLRQSPVRDFEAYRREGGVQWFADLPDHPAIRWGGNVGEDGEQQPLLSVDRLVSEECPEVPESLWLWLKGDATDWKNRPELRQRRDLPDGNATHLDDHPDVAATYGAWAEDWDRWAERMLRDEPVRAVYTDLFKIYVQSTQKSEELELLLGVGLLTWAAQSQERVRRHLFQAGVAPKLTEAEGRLEFYLDESATGLVVELDMLDPQTIPDQTLVHSIEQTGRAFEGNPLDPSDVQPLGASVAMRLHDQGRWSDDVHLTEVRPFPMVAWAPALILRPRNRSGLVQAFVDIAHQIEERGEVPTGLLPLIEPDRVPPITENPAPGALLTVGEESIAPLPLNDVQRKILQRVDSHAQTLVQGPPGTGKTHTAAALLSHLLAQGQRVLVTAHTDRALREVRSKLPSQIQPLAVSVIGASRDDLADLRTAVDHIARRASDHDPESVAGAVHEQLSRAKRLEAERRELGRTLVDARESDVSPREHRGYSGTLAAIALQYQKDAGNFGWTDGLITFGPESVAPITDAEAQEWISLLRDESLERETAQSQRRRISSQDLPDAHSFARHVEVERAARDGVAAFTDVSEVPAAQSLRVMPVGQREELQERLRGISRIAGDLERIPAQWIGDAVSDVRAGAAEVWRGRAHDLQVGIQGVDSLIEQLPTGTRVELPGDADRLRAMAVSLKRYLDQGGSLKTGADGGAKIGVFTRQIVKDCRPLLDEGRVNGLPPTTGQALDAIVAHQDAWNLLDHLDKLWPSSVIVPQEDTPRERVEWHRTQLTQLARVLELGERIRDEDAFLKARGVVPPSWTDSAAIEGFVRTLDWIAVEEVLATASLPLKALDLQLGEVTRWVDSADAIIALQAAVHCRDHEAYAAGMMALRRLEQVSIGVYRRNFLGSKMAAATPELAREVENTCTDPAWTSRLARFADAYRWGAVGAWILDQGQVDANTVQAQITVVDQQLQVIAESVAANRAWSHAVGTDRLTPGRRADLRNYSQQVSRLGKGTGKYAVQQRAAIRRAMERCRPAVPVWIMPIYRVAEQFSMEENMFDVVVVDEASQAGLEATFLQYLAPKIVVIGDDKQVSPAAVGVDQQQLRDLASQYLYDDRYKDTWLDPQRSLFDEAAMRYGGQLTLVEHRRCVPEIIGYSNRIAYEPHGITLIPVRQFGADRMRPFVVRHVADGFEEGTSGARVNRLEARALVDDLKECLNDPAFDGATMAVISLVGDKQAKYIESLLLAEVNADTWDARDLRVGTAPDFQGSERDVVFLSMVSSVAEGRRLASLTREMYVQRFNVAVSRAKDQVRLFHSVTLTELPNKEDLRHILLDYAYGVVARNPEESLGESPGVSETERVDPFDSLFEQRVYNRIVDHGYTVQPQVDAQGYRLDLVVIGSDARLAIECDGDAWHGRDAYERDMARQRELERCGWRFFRVRESTFYVDKAAALAPLWSMLDAMGIHTAGWFESQKAQRSPTHNEVHERTDSAGSVISIRLDDEIASVSGWRDEVSRSENVSERSVDEDLQRLSEELERNSHDVSIKSPNLSPAPEPKLSTIVIGSPLQHGIEREIATDMDGQVSRRNSTGGPRRADLGTEPEVASDCKVGVTLGAYDEYRGVTVPVGEATDDEIISGLLMIVAAEGPVRGNRLRTAYVVGSGGRRVGKAIGQRLNSLIARAERRQLFVGSDPLGTPGIKFRTFRLPDQTTYKLREPGPRALDEMPPEEVMEVMKHVNAENSELTNEEVLRKVLRLYGRTSLTQAARDELEPVLELIRSAG